MSEKLIQKLEEQAQWHEKLMLNYLKENDQVVADAHTIAAMCYVRAAQMARADGKA